MTQKNTTKDKTQRFVQRGFFVASLPPLELLFPTYGMYLERVSLPGHHLELGRLRVGGGRVKQGEVPELLLFTLHLGPVGKEPVPSSPHRIHIQ